MIVPAAVAKWQAAPDQDQDTVCSTPHQEATGELTLWLECTSQPSHACDFDIVCSGTVGRPPEDASLYTEYFVYERSCTSTMQTCRHFFWWRTCQGICHNRFVQLCRLLLTSIKVCPASMTANVVLALAYCNVRLCRRLCIDCGIADIGT